MSFAMLPESRSLCHVNLFVENKHENTGGTVPSVQRFDLQVAPVTMKKRSPRCAEKDRDQIRFFERATSYYIRRPRRRTSDPCRDISREAVSRI